MAYYCGTVTFGQGDSGVIPTAKGKRFVRGCAALLVVAGLLLGPAESGADNLVFSDVFPVSGGGDVAAACIALDPAGNIYHASRIVAATDIDLGPGVLTLPHVFFTDMYVAKFDAAGALQWAQAVGGVEDEAAEVIAVDSAGNNYVAGTFESSVDFDPGTGVTTLTASRVDSFKLDASGAFQWAGATAPGIGSDD